MRLSDLLVLRWNVLDEKKMMIEAIPASEIKRLKINISKDKKSGWFTYKPTGTNTQEGNVGESIEGIDSCFFEIIGVYDRNNPKHINSMVHATYRASRLVQYKD